MKGVWATEKKKTILRRILMKNVCKISKYCTYTLIFFDNILGEL
jgi:hypothetical protein